MTRKRDEERLVDIRSEAAAGTEYLSRTRFSIGCRDRSAAAEADTEGVVVLPAEGLGGIELTNLTKRFVTPTGTVMTAIRDVDLTVAPGQFCAIVGPTGCGKSTTLTLTAGLDRPSAGTVRVNGKAVDGITRGVSFVFQTDALLPWKPVAANVALGPMSRGVAKKEAMAKAREWLKTVGLAGFEDHYLPSSGSSCFGISPWLLLGEDCVEDDDELAHDGSDNELEGLSGLAQALSEGCDHRVVPDGDDSRHVERSADGRAAMTGMSWRR